MLKNLSIGVDDWQRAELVESYYPEGLPEDWRFDYYLNEYACALVAQAEWQSWSDADIDELNNALQPNNAIYLRLDRWSETLPTQLESHLLSLGSSVAGFVVFDDQASDDQLSLLGRPITRVSQHQAWSDWHWQYQGWIVSGAPCGWVADLTADAKQQAACLRDFVASLPDKNTALAFFVGGESIKMPRLQNLKTLAELLGY